jgi:GT2 family glycosyltransferase
VPPSRISIVVPTRDTREMTLRCLATIAEARAAVPVELIVVDDGGQDGTAEAVEQRFPRARVVRHATSRGFTVSANAGLRLATSPLVLLLNSDTEVMPDALDALASAFAADPRLGIAGAQLVYPDGRAQWSGGPAPTLGWLFAEASGLARALARIPGYRAARPLASPSNREVSWVTGAAMAMRREVWTEIGPLDERFTVYAQDLDFCVRARDKGWTVRVIAAGRVVHHHGVTIGRVTGGMSRQDPSALWADLIRWTDKHRGAAYARRAGAVIAAGARLRLIARRMLGPAVPARLRESWRVETRELQLALAALRGAAPAGRT